MIENAKQWWRMLVIQVAAVWSAVIAVWPMLADEQRTAILTMLGIPPQFLGGVTALAMFLTLLAARVKKQDSLHPKD